MMGDSSQGGELSTWKKKIVFKTIICVFLLTLMGGLVVGGSIPMVSPAHGLKILGNGPIDFAVTSVDYTRKIKNNNSVFVFSPKFIIINNSNETIDYVSSAIPAFWLIVNVTIYANVSYVLRIPFQETFEWVVVDHYLKPGINNGTNFYHVKAYLFIRNPNITQLPDGKYVFTMLGPNERYNGKAYSAIITSKDGVIKFYYEYNASLAQNKEPNVKDNGLYITGTLEYSLIATELLMFIAVPVILIASMQGRKTSFSF